MAITPEGIDTDRLLADPRAIEELNQSIIKEFRANRGKVGGPMEGMPILLLTMTGAKTGRTLVRPLCYSRDGDLIVIIASYGGSAEPTLVSQSRRKSCRDGRSRHRKV